MVENMFYGIDGGVALHVRWPPAGNGTMRIVTWARIDMRRRRREREI